MHIFNPSAFALFLFSVGLIATGTTEITWAEEIAVELERPQFIYAEIFFLGLIVQYFFNVTLVTLAAATALYVLNTVYTSATGIYWFLDSSITIAVFLGLHLLVTDPATSPRTDRGRFVFGALYGVGVFAVYGLLELWGAPRFYDKLLCVPILNLSVLLLDRLAVPRRSPAPQDLGHSVATTSRANLAYMAVWVGLFGWMSATDFVGTQHQGGPPPSGSRRVATSCTMPAGISVGSFATPVFAVTPTHVWMTRPCSGECRSSATIRRPNSARSRARVTWGWPAAARCWWTR